MYVSVCVCERESACLCLCLSVLPNFVSHGSFNVNSSNRKGVGNENQNNKEASTSEKRLANMSNSTAAVQSRACEARWLHVFRVMMVGALRGGGGK